MNKFSIPIVIFFIALATYIAKNGTKAANSNFTPPVSIEIKSDKIKTEQAAIHKKKKTKQKVNLEESLISSFADEDEEQIIHALNEGANPNIIFNNRNFTLAMDQSLNCNPRILKALIRAGADLSMRDTHNKSALDYAKSNGNKECIEILEASETK